MPNEISGPFVQLAAFCQTTIQENNGSLSIIRMMDRIQLVGQTPEMPAIPFQGTLVLILKSGFMRENAQITIRPNTPSGATMQSIEMSALFEGDDRGVQVVADMRGFQLTEQGLYWFDVLVNGVMFTRIPLRVIYQRMMAQLGTTGAGPSGP